MANDVAMKTNKAVMDPLDSGRKRMKSTAKRNERILNPLGVTAKDVTSASEKMYKSILDPTGMIAGYKAKEKRAEKGKSMAAALAKKTGYVKETDIGEGIHQYTDFQEFAKANKAFFAGMRSKDIGRVAAFFKKSQSDYQKRMLKHQERTRRTSLTRQGVQRRAFFEDQAESPSSGMRTTTGV